jgi:The  BURPS668_1122 family of deaminases
MTKPIKVYDGDPIRFTGITDGFLSWSLNHASLHAPVEGKAGASSDQVPLAPKYYDRERYRALDDNGRRTIVTFRDRHERDAEAQLFDLLADTVWRSVGCDDDEYYDLAAALTGEVTISSGQGPCRSCRGIIRQFRAEFPHVVVHVVYPKRNEVPIRKDELGGVYGYENAKADKGLWKITLPARGE